MTASTMIRPRQTLAGILLGLALGIALAQPAFAAMPAPPAQAQATQAQPAAAKDGTDSGTKAEPASFIGQGWG